MFGTRMLGQTPQEKDVLYIWPDKVTFDIFPLLDKKAAMKPLPCHDGAEIMLLVG